MNPTKKRTKIDPEGRTYQRRTIELMRSYMPTIYPCHECGGPVVDGYVCRWCGNQNPRRGR